MVHFEFTASLNARCCQLRHKSIKHRKNQGLIVGLNSRAFDFEILLLALRCVLSLIFLSTLTLFMFPQVLTNLGAILVAGGRIFTIAEQLH